jgi:outer membrane murein-binding lipoprotein Lpp
MSLFGALQAQIDDLTKRVTELEAALADIENRTQKVRKATKIAANTDNATDNATHNTTAGTTTITEHDVTF